MRLHFFQGMHKRKCLLIINHCRYTNETPFSIMAFNLSLLPILDEYDRSSGKFIQLNSWTINEKSETN